MKISKRKSLSSYTLNSKTERVTIALVYAQKQGDSTHYFQVQYFCWGVCVNNVVILNLNGEAIILIVQQTNIYRHIIFLML